MCSDSETVSILVLKQYREINVLRRNLLVRIFLVLRFNGRLVILTGYDCAVTIF